MPIEILMPALSPTMKEGKLIKWCKSEGDEILSGDVIAEVETDKATMEVEAVDEGKLARILIPGGTEKVSVGSKIAILLEEGETDQDLKNIDNVVENNNVKDSIVETNEKEKENIKIKNSSNVKKERIIATPLAKKIASNNKIDISNIPGSGPRGRIIKDDVLKAIETTGKLEKIEEHEDELDYIEISTMRSVIAERLVESKREIPHFYLKSDCIIDNLLKFRKEINEKLDQKITINDFIIKASALAIKHTPEINSSWLGDKIVKYKNIDISVAVAINDGLITPIVKNADLKSISEISGDVKILAGKAKKNELKPEEFQGGCFTISNLGMYGITEFSAIINPPQSAILAVGAARKLPVVVENEISIKNVMTITLSCDHRVVDGAVGANFLKEFKKFIEDPICMLV